MEELRDKALYIRAKESEIIEWKKEARLTGRSLSGWVCWILNSYLQRKQGENNG